MIGVLSEKSRDHGDSAALFGRGLTGEISHGGKDVPVRAEMGAVGACFDLSRPAGEERRVDSAFVKVALNTFVGSVGIPKVGLMSAFTMGAIVAGKKDDGVVVDA